METKAFILPHKDYRIQKILIRTVTLRDARANINK